MTIYSGFATRKLQQRYNNLITEAFQILSQLIITYVERSKIQPFEKQFRKIFLHLEKLDALKHLQPKFSTVLKPLSEHILFEDQRPQTVPEGILHYKVEKQGRRPMTSNNFVQQRRQSIQLQRKTINIVPQKSKPLRYDKDGRKSRNYSFSVKHSSNGGPNYFFTKQQREKQKQKQFDLQNNLTMEELMEKNRLVQRKMTLFRKKKHMQPNKISKIPQLDQQQEAQFM